MRREGEFGKSVAKMSRGKHAVALKAVAQKAVRQKEMADESMADLKVTKQLLSE